MLNVFDVATRCLPLPVCRPLAGRVVLCTGHCSNGASHGTRIPVLTPVPQAGERYRLDPDGRLWKHKRLGLSTQHFITSMIDS